jgi:hypothetical protein
VRPEAEGKAPIFQVTEAVYVPSFTDVAGVHDAEQVKPHP